MACLFSYSHSMATHIYTSLLLLSLLGLHFVVDDTTITYLKQSTSNPWAVMALGAHGVAVSDTAVLETKVSNASSALEMEAPLLALYAQGKDISSGRTKLLSYFTDNQLGVPGLVNDDIFGLLVLASSSQDQEKVVAIRTFILQAQNSDGGWPFSTHGLSDSNTTSMALIALKEAGLTDSNVFQKGLAYLRASQGNDGGFKYSTRDDFNAGSDANSTAWAISALRKLGENPESWVRQGANPVTYLSSLKRSDGSYMAAIGAPSDSFTSTLTSYVAIAFSESHYPVRMTPQEVSQRVDLGVTIPQPSVVTPNPVTPPVITPPSSPPLVSPSRQTITSFTVGSDSIDFGELKPGQSGERALTLINNGETSLIIAPSIQGDMVFQNYIQLNNQAWRGSSFSVPSRSTSGVSARLVLPSSYTNYGRKTGVMTFFARPL